MRCEDTERASPAAAAPRPASLPPGAPAPPDARAEYAGRSRRASHVAVHVYRIHRCRLFRFTSRFTRGGPGSSLELYIKFHSPGRRGVRTGSDVSQRTTVLVRPPTAQRTVETQR